MTKNHGNIKLEKKHTMIMCFLQTGNISGFSSFRLCEKPAFKSAEQ